MREGRGWARQVGLGGRDQTEIAGNAPDLRARRLLHGADQRHEPTPVSATWPANCKSRRLKLLSHRRRIFSFVSEDNPEFAGSFPPTCRKENAARVTCFTEVRSGLS